MSGIYKFSKISMVLGLLCAGSSWVHAMDPDEDSLEELTRAVQLSLQEGSLPKKPLSSKGYVAFEGSDEDFAAIIAAQQELYAQKRAKPKAVVQPKKHVNHDLGMDTTEMTEEEIWALIQNNETSHLVSKANHDTTPQEWAAIEKRKAAAHETRHNNWVAGPQEDKADMPYLRADFIPAYVKEGQGLGDMLCLMEKNRAIGIETWNKRADFNEQQMKQRKVVPSAPQLTAEQKAVEEAKTKLQNLKFAKVQQQEAPKPDVDVKNVFPFGPKVALKKVSPKEDARPNPVVNEQPTDVKDIADRFGGRGGFKNPAKK